MRAQLKWWFSGLVVWAAICAAPALAASDSLEEIVVTATHRSETILSVPLSITAVDSQALKEEAATSFFDYASTVPNLSFATTGFGITNSRTIALRGIADTDTTGLYIDDTPVPEALDPRIFDANRIEVLRGPQGTLYGARSMGGTVRLITTQPDTSIAGGNVHANLSTTADTPNANYQIDGAYNLPITDKIAARATGIYQSDSGWFVRQFPVAGGLGNVSNTGASKTAGGSIAVLFKPTDDLSITPRIMYQRISIDGFPLADVAVLDPAHTVYLVPGSFIQKREFDIPESAVDKFVLATTEIRLVRKFGTFLSSTSYFDRDNNNIEDDSLAIYTAFGTPPVPVTIEDDLSTRAFTQEFRFLSTFQGPFQVVGGLYYTKARGLDTFPPTTVRDYAPFGSTNVFSGAFRTSDEEFAVYAEGTLEITDHLSVIGGLRWFRTDVEGQTTTDGLAVGGLNVGPSRSVKDNGVTPKFSAQYKFSEDAQVYATAAKGFRPGGVQNPIVSPLCTADLAALGKTPDETGSWESDHVWSYEIGAKGRIPDHKVTASVAVFLINWDNLPQTVSLPCGFNFRTNAGTARSKGAEFEFSAEPIAGLKLGGGFGYTDAKIQSSVPGGTFLRGDPIAQVPKYTVSADGGYEWSVGPKTSAFVHADYKYVSQSTSNVNAIRDPDTGGLVARVRPQYAIIGARAGMQVGNYEVAIFGKNLTNEIASLSDILSLGIEAPGRARMSMNQPRTIGIEMRATF